MRLLTIVTILFFCLQLNAARIVNDNTLTLGTNQASSVNIQANVLGTPDPAIRFNYSTLKWQYSNDGTTYTDLSSLPTLTKGQLITHNGTTYVAANACANNEMIVWDSTQAYGFKCVARPYRLINTQRITTGTTYTRFSADVRKVEFYYCGGGGAGGGAVVNSSTTVSYGFGGSAGQTRKCTILNPTATIAISVGTGGTGVSAGNGGSGTATTITGCTSASGGGGGLAGAAITVASASLVGYTTQCGEASADILADNLVFSGCISARPHITSTYSISGAGSQVPPLAQAAGLRSDAGNPQVNTSNNGDAGTLCGGGGGALNLAAAGPIARTGGAGGGGQILALEYE